MLPSIILLLVLFIIMLVLIGKGTIERAAIVLICALVAFFIIITLEKAPPDVVVGFLFGTVTNNFTNFHTLLLIFGMMVISTICQQTGLFQFIASKMIQVTRGDPKKLVIFIGLFTYGVSAILEDSITAIILIPITIIVCKSLALKPAPYVIMQALFIKLGATVLPISSVPSIMITTDQGITFFEYLATAGLVSFSIAIFTILIFLMLFRQKSPKDHLLVSPSTTDLDTLHVPKDRKMMYVSLGTFIAIIFGFIFIPPAILSSDAIAFTGAMFLVLCNIRKAEVIFKAIDFNFLLYLLGIFIITGCLDYVGVINLIAQGLTFLGITDLGFAFLALLWIGAVASAFVDNIPITQLFLPLINVLMGAKGTSTAKIGSMGLSLGVIWGDNFTPFGDSILALAVAKSNDVTIQPKDFFKYGFPITLLQLGVISLVVLLLFDAIIGLIVCGIAGIILCVIFHYHIRKKSRQIE